MIFYIVRNIWAAWSAWGQTTNSGRCPDTRTRTRSCVVDPSVIGVNATQPVCDATCSLSDTDQSQNQRVDTPRCAVNATNSCMFHHSYTRKTHTHARTYVHTQRYTHTHTHTHTHTRTHTQLYTHIHIYRHTDTDTDIYTHTQHTQCTHNAHTMHTQCTHNAHTQSSTYYNIKVIATQTQTSTWTNRHV